MTTESICTEKRCLARFDGPPDSCPHCGGKAVSMRSMRIRGWTAIACGVFLVGMMAVISWYAAPMMMNAGAETANGRFEGSQMLGYGVLGLFAFIALFGLVAIRMGMGMVRTGRVDLTLRWIALNMAFVFMGLGLLAEVADEFF